MLLTVSGTGLRALLWAGLRPMLEGSVLQDWVARGISCQVLGLGKRAPVMF